VGEARDAERLTDHPEKAAVDNRHGVQRPGGALTEARELSDAERLLAEPTARPSSTRRLQIVPEHRSPKK
jgi:hypothetical protein